MALGVELMRPVSRRTWRDVVTGIDLEEGECNNRVLQKRFPEIPAATHDPVTAGEGQLDNIALVRNFKGVIDSALAVRPVFLLAEVGAVIPA